MNRFSFAKCIAIILSTAYLSACDAPKPVCGGYDPETVEGLKLLGVTFSSDTQQDYPRINQATTCYMDAYPTNTEETQALVSFAYQHDIPMRIQGNSHSFNGSSLPKRAELLLHTNRMNKLSIVNDHQIIVGSGVPSFLINFYLNDIGIAIPIVNAGNEIAPTIGGFISAGGISPDSTEFGGFWDNVDEITLVAADGKRFDIKRDDPLFLWLFGSMGQLGVITKAKLKTFVINPLLAANKIEGEKFVVDYDALGGRHHYQNQNKLLTLWIALLVPEDRVEEAKKDLDALREEHPDALFYTPLTYYLISTENAPPLLSNAKNGFYLVSLWGYNKKSDPDKKGFIELNKAYTELVARKKYHRYYQTEYGGSPAAYKAYFAKSVYDTFGQLKQQYDPKSLFNRGSVFTYKKAN